MRNIRTSNLVPFVLIIILCSILLLAMLAYPTAVLTSSVRGLAIWWDILFPSLLPFFVVSEILLGFGIVHFIGTLLHPIMRPLFKVPGSGGFVMVMGYASGYPVGAKLATQLRKKNWITRTEGERLVAFTTSSDPIFLISVVSIGFLNDIQLALPIGIAHYGTSIIVGLLMRYHIAPSPSSILPPSTSVKQAISDEALPLLVRAFWSMHTARQQDGRSFSMLLQDSILSSLQLITVIGGMVVFFSVVMELWFTIGAFHIWEQILQYVLKMIQLPQALSTSISEGIFEVTLGVKRVGTATDVQTHVKVVVAAWILSWGGLSVHAQIISLTSECDLRYMPFLLARCIHSFLAAIVAAFLYPFFINSHLIQPAWLPISTFPLNVTWKTIKLNLQGAILLLSILASASFVIIFIRKMSHLNK